MSLRASLVVLSLSLALGGCGLGEKLKELQAKQARISTALKAKNGDDLGVSLNDHLNNGIRTVTITVQLKQAPEDPAAFKAFVQELAKKEYPDVENLDVVVSY